LPEFLVPAYVANVAAIAAPDAKMMLFTKAYREGRPFADPRETALRAEWVRNRFAATFALERAEPTYLNPSKAEDPLPGMAFWLARK
jgi:hypothetical protein